MIGYLAVWVVFAAFLLLFALLVLIQLIRQGIARLRKGRGPSEPEPRSLPPDPAPAPKTTCNS